MNTQKAVNTLSTKLNFKFTRTLSGVIIFVLLLSCFASLYTLDSAVATDASGAINFTETGLAFGTSWSVTVNGTDYSSTTSNITLSNLSEGVYTYSVDTPAGYVSNSSLSGNLTVTNALSTVSISFSTRALGSWTYGARSQSGDYLAAASDGGYALASTYSSSGSSFCLTKVNSKGEFQWNKTYSQTSDSNENVFDIVACPDGGYAIVGYSDIPFDSNGQDFFFVRTDASGNLLWSKSWGGSGTDVARSVIATSDGGFAVAGFTSSFGAGGYDAWLIRVDSSGKQLWNETYGGTGSDYAYAITALSGGFALTGATNGDAWLIRVDSSGNQLWYKTYGGAKNDAMFDIISNSDGGFSMAGDTYSYSSNAVPNAWFLRVSSIGEIRYNQTYGGVNADCFYGIAPVLTGTSGAYVCVGYTGGAAWVVKISGDTLEWEKYFDGPDLDVGYDIIACADGGFAMSGQTGTGCILLGSTDNHGGVVEPTRYTLTMLTSGSGSVLPGNGTCVRNANITLNAIAASGYNFVGWSGNTSGATNTTITMDSNKTVTATFIPTIGGPTTHYYITVNSAHGSPTSSGKVSKGGSYTVSVSSTESAGDDIRWKCTGYQIDSGDLVEGSSYTFEEVSANHTISFSWQKQYKVTITSSAGGSVSPSIAGRWVNGGTLDISATPSSGYSFSSWSTSGGANINAKLSASTYATITGPCTITANFTPADSSADGSDSNASPTDGSSPTVPEFSALLLLPLMLSLLFAAMALKGRRRSTPLSL